jgi:hypothetical protein
MTTHRPAADRLAQLEQKRLQIEARIATLSARELAQQRKDDDRRRLLLGTILLEDLATNPVLADYVRGRLPDVLRDSDRKRGLFKELLDTASK